MTAFEKYRDKAYPYQFEATILVGRIMGGTPLSQDLLVKHVNRKLADKDDLTRQEVADLMVERSVTADEAARLLVEETKLNGFLRDPLTRQLCHEGRKIKACLKEAAMVAANAGKIDPKGWAAAGVDKNYAKGIKNWLPEHIFVLEDLIPMGVTEPTGVMQSFVRSMHGSSISYEEYVDDAKISFTVVTDYKFTPEQWAMIWLTAELQGTGAVRSQGYGTFTVERWEPLS